jgi:PAS domain S-box-containing protein
MILGPHFGDYQAGFRFGRLGYDLVEKRGLRRYQARVYMLFGTIVMPWTKHIHTGRALVRRAFDTANKTGDLAFAAYSCHHLITNLLAAGDSLSEVQREAENGLEFAQKARFGLAIDVLTAQLGLIRTLRGLRSEFGSCIDDRFDESRVEHHSQRDPGLAFRGCWYWIRKLQARVYANDFASALKAASRAEQLLWTSPSFFEVAEYHFYAALARAAQYDAASADERAQHLEALASHHNQLKTWAENCPENFANRAALIGAEMARLDGGDRDAMDLYEQAIRSARDNGFVHNEAIANERAGCFYAKLGFEVISHAYLGNARYCYARWGADAKVRQLEQAYPRLKDDLPVVAGPTSTIGTPIEHLDLATVLKLSQAVSGEIVLEKLIDTLMRMAVAQAGAERALLILSRDAELRITAEAMTHGDTVAVHLRDDPVTTAMVSEAVLHYALHTRESVILDDAATDPVFATDSYIRQRRAQSILCLPLINQSKLMGVFYLENNLAPRVFTPAWISVLRLVASQAAIALENTRLYRDLATREAKIRRLVDANIIGIFIWEFEGRILEANDAFLRMVGYDRQDFVASGLRWTDLTPPEWRGRIPQELAELETTTVIQPFEKAYFRKDGSQVPVLIGAATLEQGRDQGVAFVLDLTGRKRAEQALRQAQAQLTHLARVMTMGELAASIAHEINQPLTTIAINASAGLRWLAREPPDVEEVRACLQHTLRESHRASDVITRIRSLIKKSPPVKTSLDLNDAIHEVLSLIAPEARRHAVLVQAELADRLAAVRGDRVQLQQVILNLAMNGIDAMKDMAGRPRELWIRSHSHEVGTVLVAVEDTGIGLEAETLERVFEAFYTTKAEGMGMGLSISRSIIAAHGGKLWPSANHEHGATFQFTLPTEDTYDRDTAEVRSR